MQYTRAMGQQQHKAQHVYTATHAQNRSRLQLLTVKMQDNSNETKYYLIVK